MKQLDIYHIDDKCQIARFGFYQDFYKISLTGDDTGNADLLEPKNNCPRKQHAMIVSSEGEKYYDAVLKGGKLSINTYKISFAGNPKQIETENAHELLMNDLKDLSNCFADFGSFYCVVQESASDGPPLFRLLRFTKKGTNFFEHFATLNFGIRHGIMPRNILQDSQSGHIAIVYDDFAGHEGKSMDIRSLFALGDRGKLVRAQFPVHQTLGIASHNNYRYFVVYPKHLFRSQMSANVYTFYRAPTDYPISNKEVLGTNWDKLESRKARHIQMFFKNSMPDHFQLARFSAQRCVRLMKKIQICQEDQDALEGVKIALIVVASVLLAIFILLVALLLVYLLCCVKTKRRRRRKRKHRKHRKHRKALTETSSKPKVNSEEVEVEPGKPEEEEEEKPEDNKVVKKLKEFGGVDYSSSSSEDPEHSQAYFSARDQFDTKASTAVNASNTPGGETNQNYENLGPADPASAIDQGTGTGATPEEHDMQDKYGAKPSGPRSVYMKPKKKKK
uniref:Uncharacterized protein n=1 Tax=Panagrolaimus superbus TaxID=310955 RepID=A0A914Y8T3_9BILA